MDNFLGKCMEIKGNEIMPVPFFHNVFYFILFYSSEAVERQVKDTSQGAGDGLISVFIQVCQS